MADVKGGYRRPTNSSFISSSYDDHKNRDKPSTEPGTDYGVAYGTPLYAPEDGRILLIDRDPGGAEGRRISIGFNDGLMGSAIHCKDQFQVGQGQLVKRDQLIGFTGASAWGKEWGVGAHVHFTLFPSHQHIFGTYKTLDFERYIGADNDGGTPGRAGYADGSVELKRFQEKLILMGHNLGPTGADAKYGNFTKDATLFEQQQAEKNGYPGGVVTDDGLPGPSTEAYLDWWLVGRHQSQGHKATVQDIASLPNKRGLQKVAKLYGYQGALDNDWGPGSIKGFQTFLDRNYGGSLPQWLRVKYNYVGDDIWGPVMAAAATRADTANWLAL